MGKKLFNIFLFYRDALLKREGGYSVFSNGGLDVEQSRMYEAHSEGQTH